MTFDPETFGTIPDSSIARRMDTDPEFAARIRATEERIRALPENAKTIAAIARSTQLTTKDLRTYVNTRADGTIAPNPFD